MTTHCTSWPYIRIFALSQYTHRKFDVLVLFSFSANLGNNRATCATLSKHVARATYTCCTCTATSDYGQRHVIALRPISVAACSWSYDKVECCQTYQIKKSSVNGPRVCGDVVSPTQEGRQRRQTTQLRLAASDAV